jgi:Protein of unknown function (DUF1552)
MKNWDIDRRNLLKSLGLGAACLPILRSSKVWADGGGPKRFLLIHNSEGYILPVWKPPVGPLGAATFPTSTKSLEAFRNDVTFVTNMDQPAYPEGYNWAHECYGVIYWGGPSTKPGSSKYHEPNGATLDQIIAKSQPLEQGQRLTLNLMAQVDNKPASGTEGSRRCFWSGKGAPINPQGNPATVYGELFAGRPVAPPTGAAEPTGPDPAVAKLLGTQKSILDYVGKSLERFKMRVGREERGSIEGHFSAIRTLETEISGLGRPRPGSGAGYTPPVPMPFDNAAIASQPKLFPDIMKAQLDIALAALTAGVTRVATLQLSNSAGNYFNFGEFVAGVPARNSTGYKSQFVNFHDAAHNPQQNGIKVKELIDKWFMDRFAEFLGKAKAVEEPGGNFLDNSAIMWGNHMGDGGAHSAYQIAWILAGKAGGAMRSGVHIDGGSPIRGGGGGKTTSNAMADICRIMGVKEMPAHFTGTVGLVNGA